jgi:hypothetical protein
MSRGTAGGLVVRGLFMKQQGGLAERSRIGDQHFLGREHPDPPRALQGHRHERGRGVSGGRDDVHR